MSEGKNQITEQILTEIKKTNIDLLKKALSEIIEEKMSQDQGNIVTLSETKLIAWMILRGINETPFFSKSRGRWNWEVAFSALRYLEQKFKNSYLSEAVMPGLKLEEAQEEIKSFMAEVIKSLRLCELLYRDFSKYIENYAAAVQTTDSFQKRNQHLENLYAGLKTWTKDESWENFLKILRQFTEEKISILIEGPLQLCLIISRDNLFIFLRLLTMDSLFSFEDSLEDKEKTKELEDLETIVKHFLDQIENAKGITLVKEVLVKTIRRWANLWEKELLLHRNLMPGGKEAREDFLEKFEKGYLFR